MKNRELSKLKKIFEKIREVKLVYYFGSRAEGKAGPLSDYDFAVYVEPGGKKRRFDIRLDLMAELGRLLKTDHVKVLIEPRILHEYFDCREMLLRYNLTSES